MANLWEVTHPYYISEGNYYSNECHSEWKTWQAFDQAFRDADLDYNWFVAWEWREGKDFGAGEYTGDDYYRNGVFAIQMIERRKALLASHSIAVCRADEPAIIEFLKPRWEYMREMWAPFSGNGVKHGSRSDD